MANKKDLFAPPTQDELNMFAAPSAEELALTQEQPESQPGMVESGLRGAAQGLTFGGADELTAALESALTDKTYQKALEESRGAYKAAEEAHPYVTTAGNIVGGIGGAAGLGTLGGAVGLGGAAAKGAQALTTAQKLANAAKIGAGYSALTGLGTSEKSLTEQPLELAKDVTQEAAIGSVAGPLLHGAGQLAGKAIKAGTQQASKVGVVQNILKSFETGKEGTSYFIPEHVEALESKATQAAGKAREAMQEKLRNLGTAKTAILQEAEAQGKTVDVLPLFNKAKQQIEQLTTDEIPGADKRKLQSILDALPAETDYRDLSPSKVDNIKRMFQRYTGAGEDALRTPEGRQVALDMVRDLDNSVMNSVDDNIVSSALSKLQQSPATASAAQDAENYLAANKGNTSTIKTLNKGLSDMLTAQDVLGQSSTANRAEQIAQVEKLRKVLGRTAAETEGGVSARQALNQVRQVVKNVAPDLDEKAFAPAEELGKQLQIGKYAKGQLSSGPLDLFGLGSLATVGGANIAGSTYGMAEKLATPGTTAFKAIADYAARSGGPDNFMSKALNKIAETTDANRRAAMVNTLMQNPYYRSELEKLKKAMSGDSGDGNEIK